MKFYAEALEEANANWARWSDCYERKWDSLREMPLVQDPRIFLGFCKEYSVFRKSPEDTLKLAALLKSGSSPDGFAELYNEIIKEFRPADRGEQMVSLTSKILAKWRPENFAMWDHFARTGLARWKRRHKQHANASDLIAYRRDRKANIETYREFRDAFFRAARSDKEFRAFALANSMAPTERKEAFVYRAFDTYLVFLGKAPSDRKRDIGLS